MFNFVLIKKSGKYTLFGILPGTFVVGTVDVHSGYFYVDIYNSTGNHVDNSFYFVVYKK